MGEQSSVGGDTQGCCDSSCPCPPLVARLPKRPTHSRASRRALKKLGVRVTGSGGEDGGSRTPDAMCGTQTAAGLRAAGTWSSYPGVRGSPRQRGSLSPSLGSQEGDLATGLLDEMVSGARSISQAWRPCQVGTSPVTSDCYGPVSGRGTAHLPPSTLQMLAKGCTVSARRKSHVCVHVTVCVPTCMCMPVCMCGEAGLGRTGEQICLPAVLLSLQLQPAGGQRGSAGGGAGLCD